MFNWIRKVFEPDKPRSRRRHHVEEDFTRRNPPAKLPPRRPDQPHRHAYFKFAKGDRIGVTFHVYGVLSQGGFGTVLVVYDLEVREVCALKTFRDELLANAQAREAFKLEASRWVDIGEHPFILTARSVREISNRLFVKMDYVVPDEDGRVSLAHYLCGRARQPIALVQQLEWAIQFCLGMEHANQRGIRCHRDIKPQNILITANKSLKISDFGLALVAEASSIEKQLPLANGTVAGEQQFSLSLLNAGDKRVCGTPGYIPPEIYRGEPGDARSDIYSFGLVLWQMAAQSPMPPFSHYLEGSLDAYLRMIYETQMAGQALPVESPLQPLIAKCLAKDPADRYQTFAELREDLETLLWREAGKSVEVPRQPDATAAPQYQRAISLFSLQRYDEALAAVELALQVAPQDLTLLVSRSECLSRLARTDEALHCCEEALRINPNHPGASFSKATVLETLGQQKAALACYEKTLTLLPNYFRAWQGKARCLTALGQNNEALACCDRVLQLQPKAPASWDHKATVLGRLNRLQEALACFDQALACDPQYANSWKNKGIALSQIKQFPEAMRCLEKALDINPDLARAWAEKGAILHLLKRNSEAIQCLDKALSIDPSYAIMWYNKGLAEEVLRHFPEAIACFSRFLESARPQDAPYIHNARARLQKLKIIVSSRPS